MPTGPGIAVSVVVPSRNSATWIADCLAEPRAERVAEIILVDGGSTDGTLEIAEPLVDQVLQDEGTGPAAARMLGIEAATQPWVLLLDSDVVMPAGGVAKLLDEALAKELDGIQAAQESEGSDPWSNALADHHRRGSSRRWFGTNATLLRREVLQAYPLDDRLRSGEDIDLRLRLTGDHVPIGVSDNVTVRHRFAPGRPAAAEQWDDDGRGLGRVVRKHGWRALPNAFVPLAVGTIGIVAAPFRRGADGARYYLGYLFGNYRGLVRGLLDGRVPVNGLSARAAMTAAFVGLGLSVVAAAAIAVGIPVALLSSAVGEDPRLVSLAGLGSVLALVWLELSLSFPAGDRRHDVAASLRIPILIGAAIGLGLAGLRLLAIIKPLG